MNDLQVFSNPDFGNVRTFLIDNEPWFVGSDVATILEYADVNKAVTMHVDESDRKALKYKASDKMAFPLWTNPNDFSDKILINEGGLYSLIFRSKLDTAREFQRWVSHEVIPSIRKTGSYSVIKRESLSPTLQMLYMLADNSAALELKQKQLEERQDDQDAKIAYLGKALNNMKDAYTTSFGDWRDDANKYVYKIAKARDMDVKDVYTELYGEFKIISGAKLDTLVSNKRKRMTESGMTKTIIDRETSKLAVISDDKRLRAIFEGIIKKAAVKYLT